jgi:hypothetical protein
VIDLPCQTILSPILTSLSQGWSATTAPGCAGSFPLRAGARRAVFTLQAKVSCRYIFALGVSSTWAAVDYATRASSLNRRVERTTAFLFCHDKLDEPR